MDGLFVTPISTSMWYGFSATNSIKIFYIQLKEDVLDDLMIIECNGSSIHQLKPGNAMRLCKKGGGEELVMGKLDTLHMKDNFFCK